MAMLNTSDEVRGITVQEVRDMAFTFDQRPRAFTVLFETDDLLGIQSRARNAGHRIVEPVLGEIPATPTTPHLRFIEFAIIDPDNHVVAFFQYFQSDEAWAQAQQIHAELRAGQSD